MTNAGLIIERIGLGATVQDAGRSGHMHEGVPPGGSLVPALFAAANASLGNVPSAAAIEILGAATLRATGDLVVAIDGEPHALRADEILDLPATMNAVRYVALAGGVDVPIVLGGRGTLLVAAFGGHEGRVLQPSDLLRSLDAAPARVASSIAPTFDHTQPIRVIPGPDAFPPEVLEALLRQTFQVGPSDRVGMRLTGGRLPVDGADATGSLPMVRGAIQVTRDGTPIVLGPDHPTTGGYRVLAVVHSADFGELAMRRAGSEVRFVAVDPAAHVTPGVV